MNANIKDSDLKAMRQVLEYTERLDRCQTSDHLLMIINDFARHFLGMDGGGIEIGDGMDNHFWTSRPEEWMAIYKDKGYASVDPTVQFAFLALPTGKHDFTWREAAEAYAPSTVSRRVMYHAHDFGLSEGFSRLTISDGWVSGISMYSTNARHTEEIWGAYRQLISFFSHAAHCAACRILCNAPKLADKLQSLNGNQLDVIILSLQGLDNKQIAARLNIQKRAVQARVQSIKERLGAKSNQQLWLALTLATNTGIFSLSA